MPSSLSFTTPPPPLHLSSASAGLPCGKTLHPRAPRDHQSRLRMGHSHALLHEMFLHMGCSHYHLSAFLHLTSFQFYLLIVPLISITSIEVKYSRTPFSLLFRLHLSSPLGDLTQVHAFKCHPHVNNSSSLSVGQTLLSHSP